MTGFGFDIFEKTNIVFCMQNHVLNLNWNSRLDLENIANIKNISV